MGLYVYIGRDGPRGRELRKQHREAHLAKLRTLASHDRVRFGGPLLASDGSPCGSVVIIEAESLDAARAFAESDPYRVEGIFERLEVFETRAVFPE